MLAWSDTEIRAKVPPSAETGTIALIKDGERITGDTFTIREKQLELMAEKTITPSAEFQEINHEEIGVLLPPEFTAEELPLAISRVSNAPGYGDDMYADTPVYKITMGDKRQLFEIVIEPGEGGYDYKLTYTVYTGMNTESERRSMGDAEWEMAWVHHGTE